MSADKSYIALSRNTAWIRIMGRGTFQNSHSIKRWFLDNIERGYDKIIIDLSECMGMDSTFMGILTGLSLRMRKRGLGPISIINVSMHNMRLLATLGLDKFLNIKDDCSIDNNLTWEILPATVVDKLNMTKHMLGAHEDLIETGEDALKEFKGVHKMLKDDLVKQIKHQQKEKE